MRVVETRTDPVPLNSGDDAEGTEPGPLTADHDAEQALLRAGAQLVGTAGDEPLLEGPNSL